jgi:hypothetical protein
LRVTSQASPSQQATCEQSAPTGVQAGAGFTQVFASPHLSPAQQALVVQSPLSGVQAGAG